MMLLPPCPNSLDRKYYEKQIFLLIVLLQQCFLKEGEIFDLIVKYKDSNESNGIDGRN